MIPRRRNLARAVRVLGVLFVLTGCAKAKDAAVDTAQQAADAAQDAASDVVGSAPSAASGDTASAFYSAYSESKSAVITKLMDGLGNNPDTTMSAFSFLGATTPAAKQRAAPRSSQCHPPRRHWEQQIYSDFQSSQVLGY